MILKSFFRKKIIYIYSIILIVLISGILVLNGYINQLHSIEDNIYANSSFLIVRSKINYEDYSRNNKSIISVTKGFLFDANMDNEDQIIKSADDYVEGENLNWDLLKNYDIGSKIVVHVDENKEMNLAYDEVALGFDENVYEIVNEYEEKIKGKLAIFKYNDLDVSLKISRIYPIKSDPEITISNELYEKLLSNSVEYTNILVIASEKEANRIQDELKKEKDNYVIRVWSTTTEDDRIIEKTNESLFSLKISNYVIVVILILLILIINKNIVEDLKDNLSLERKLGFNLHKIKINVFKRLCILHLLNILLSIMISTIMLCVVRVNANMNITSMDITHVIILSILIIIYDIFISLTVKVK